jgi:hypothetical protein
MYRSNTAASADYSNPQLVHESISLVTLNQTLT